jgi:hypothetical protein
MRKWGLAFTVGIIACSGAPAAWAGDAEIAVSDPCGDNRAAFKYDDQRYDLPETERRPGFDVKHFTLSQTASGVRAVLEMCGPIADSVGLSGWRAAAASLTDECSLTLAVEEGVAPQRKGRFIKTCWTTPEGPAAGTPLNDGVETRFDITLPDGAFTVSGATMTINLARAGLTGEAAQALAAGTAWKNPGFSTVEGATLGGAGVYADSNGNTHGWAWAAPFNYDWGYTQSAFTLS